MVGRSADLRDRFGARVSSRLRSRDDFPTALGQHVVHGNIRGYYIDLSRKAVNEPSVEQLVDIKLHVVTCQWGLGCYERYLAGEGERWLDAAVRVGHHLIETQQLEGGLAGSWHHDDPFPHTYRLGSGWVSAMAQGQGASLLVRLFRETGQEKYADAARRALSPLRISALSGGVLRMLHGGPFIEEYPTDPPSFVLNGAIFGMWGCFDVGTALADREAMEGFAGLSTTLAENLHLWDTGFWSRYDLYPHPVANIAAPWYHALHVAQLTALAQMTDVETYRDYASRWKAYLDSPWNHRRALIQKIALRLLVPRRSRSLSKTRSTGSRDIE